MKHYKNQYYAGGVDHNQVLKSANRDDVLDFIIRTDLVNWYTTFLLKEPITSDFVQDYIQEIWVQLSEISQEKWQDLYDQGKAAITAFVAGIIHNNCISVKSRAYYHIKKPTINEVHFTSDQWLAFDEDGSTPFTLQNNNNDYNENLWDTLYGQ